MVKELRNSMLALNKIVQPKNVT